MRSRALLFLLFIYAISGYGQVVYPKVTLEKKKAITQIENVDEAIENARIHWLAGQDSLAYSELETTILAAKKINYPMGEANARSQWVRIEMDYQDQAPLAQKHLDTMFQLAKSAKMPLIEGIALFRKAQIDYEYPERYEKAVQMLHRSNEIFIKEGNKQWQALYYAEYGSLLTMNGSYFEALDVLLKAKKIQEDLKLDNNLRSTLSGIANIYLIIKQYDKALKVTHELEALSTRLNDLSTQVFCKNQKGVILTRQSKYSEAITQFKEGIGIQEPNGLNQRLVSLYANLAVAYIKMNELETAKTYNELAKKGHKELTGDDSWGYHLVIYNDSRLALLGGRYEEAIKIAKGGLEILAKSGSSYALENRDYYEVLSNAYEKIGAGQKALESFKNFKNWSDTINNLDVNTKLLEKAYNYEIAKKEQEALLDIQKLKEQKLRNTRNFLIGLSILGIFITVYIFRTNRALKQKNIELNKNREE